MKVSAIVPVYKVEEEFLRACLDSIVDQKNKDFEVILIDDGSPDKCGQICDEYAEKDNRFRVIHKSNEGVSAARNQGMQQAQGEWIVFVDADDWIEPETFNLVDDVAADVDVVFYGGYHNFPDQLPIETMPFKSKMHFNGPDQMTELQRMVLGRKYGSLECEPGCIFCNVSCKYIRNVLIKQNDLRYDTGISQGEDGVFNLSLLEVSNSCVFVPFAGYHYRMRATSATHAHFRDGMQDICLFAETVRRFEKRHNKACLDLALLYRCYDYLYEKLEPTFFSATCTMSVTDKIGCFDKATKMPPLSEAIKTIPFSYCKGKSKIKLGMLKCGLGWLLMMLICLNHWRKARRMGRE